MTSSDLWTFALRCYARPGVEDACLELQTLGADVCVLLCAAQLEARGVACEQGRLHLLEEVAAPWRQQVIQPLRHLRQAWRPLAEQDEVLRNLRETLKKLELEAERSLLERLHAASSGWAAATGPNDWLGALAPTANCRAALETLRSAAYQTQLELDDV
ncbi:TIGR02444 family protein [Pseudomonas sp. GD03855]|nr:TIGR02444 family protein [Pseudomonas sp. GD03856]MDH2264007.1 TIGR02444 family protein [Pseudomonas sp. GD03855]